MRRVIITGGLGVLGRAVWDVFRAAGDEVIVIDRVDGGGGVSASIIGGVDLTDARQAEAAVRQAVDRLGGLDVLVNVTGGFCFEPIVTGDASAWSAMYAINVQTCLNTCRAAIGAMDAGAIVNVGAMAAGRAGYGMGAYAASKAAVARLTESLAEEVGPRIRVNAVLPLTLDTPQNRIDMPDADPADWTTPGAVGEVISFLASPAARAVTGASVPVTAPG